MQHRIETKIEPNGTIILRGLPFLEGDKVVVVISTPASKSSQAANYPLQGLPVEYKNPFEPVAENDWSAIA